MVLLVNKRMWVNRCVLMEVEEMDLAQEYFGKEFWGGGGLDLIWTLVILD